MNQCNNFSDDWDMPARSTAVCGCGVPARDHPRCQAPAVLPISHIQILSDSFDKKISDALDRQLQFFSDIVDKKISGIETKISDMDMNMKSMNGHLKLLSDTFNKYEPIFQKAGLTYELAVRREVRELRGLPYARVFRVANLAGLARISSPKDTDNNFCPIQDWDTHLLLQQRTHQLAKQAITFIPRTKLMMNNNAIHPKKKHLLSSQLLKYDALESDSERLNFLESNVLGLIAFSCIAFNDTQSFEETLECDVRGESIIRGEMIQITIGEIKSGKDRRKALVQLLKRLCIVGHATHVIFGEVVSRAISLDLQGEIFTPLMWSQFSDEEIHTGLADHKLIVPAGGNIHIKIIFLS